MKNIFSIFFIFLFCYNPYALLGQNNTQEIMTEEVFCHYFNESNIGFGDLVESENIDSVIIESIRMMNTFRTYGINVFSCLDREKVMDFLLFFDRTLIWPLDEAYLKNGIYFSSDDEDGENYYRVEIESLMTREAYSNLASSDTLSQEEFCEVFYYHKRILESDKFIDLETDEQTAKLYNTITNHDINCINENDLGFFNSDVNDSTSYGLLRNDSLIIKKGYRMEEYYYEYEIK